MKTMARATWRLCAAHNCAMKKPRWRLALPLLRAAHDAFGQRDLDAFAKALTTHQQSLNLMEEINQRRQRFRVVMASGLEMEPSQITWAHALARVPSALRADLAVQAARCAAVPRICRGWRMRCRSICAFISMPIAVCCAT